MHEWLEQAGERLAASVGDQPSVFELSPVEIDALLELARHAAHESGERSNAPLLTYLVGLARSRHPDKDLRTLVDDAVGRDGSST